MSSENKKNFNATKYITVKGASTNNLKHISVQVPRNKLILVVGPSGAGKSSFVFGTLFAEGRRRYMESLSTYTRQFLTRVARPPVDCIKGILPSVGLQQKTRFQSPKSRVGTATAIYPYLKLLYARIGITYSPVSGKVVQQDTPLDIVDYIQSQPAGSKVLLLALLSIKKGSTITETLKVKLSRGFDRLVYQKETYYIEDLLCQGNTEELLTEDSYLLIDRLLMPDKTDAALVARLVVSVKTALLEGEGSCIVFSSSQGKRTFSNLFEADGIKFHEPTTQFFSFNNPYGACKRCEGLGKSVQVDPDKVIPNPNLSVAAGAITPWQTSAMHRWQERLLHNSHKFAFPIHRPYRNLTKEQQELLWRGNKFFKGIHDFFAFIDSKAYKIQYRVLRNKYRSFSPCSFCEGTGLKEEVCYVKVGSKHLVELLKMPIASLIAFFDQLQLTPYQEKVVKTLLEQIKSRLHYLEQVGLSYLSLHRFTNTLSAGEYQRVRLAKALGGSFLDILYTIDEPTVGLDVVNTEKVARSLCSLRDMGNTVIAIEHKEAVIRMADQIIELGPEAGAGGGKIVFQGSLQELLQTETGTAQYLTGKKLSPLPYRNRNSSYAIKLEGVRENNLKNVSLSIPLELLNVVTGPSGSGKTTLVSKVLFPALCNCLRLRAGKPGILDNIGGDLDKIEYVEQLGENPLGKSARSTPVTYIKVYDVIRKIFSQQPMAVRRGYTPIDFSFNMAGGRCEACLGTGVQKIDMQFLPDVQVVCESCKGACFKQEVLEVSFAGKNIMEVLGMTIEEGITFFQGYPEIVSKLTPLRYVGLGYLKLGQPTSTFSGGEAQRLKLSSYLKKENNKRPKTLLILDEPTKGLDFHGTVGLVRALQDLVDLGYTILVIDHNTTLMQCADWIIDMGPEGGDQGGQVVFSGSPKQLLQLTDNHTAQHLRQSQKRFCAYKEGMTS